MAGDLTKDRLGMSETDRAMVTAETDIVINSAASTDFDESLLDSIEINFYGCMKMLELAKECK